MRTAIIPHRRNPASAARATPRRAARAGHAAAAIIARTGHWCGAANFTPTPARF